MKKKLHFKGKYPSTALCGRIVFKKEGYIIPEAVDCSFTAEEIEKEVCANCRRKWLRK